MTMWGLPTSAEFGGVEYRLNCDYRDILEIFGYLNDLNTPEWLRWQIALGLFYEGDIPPEYQSEAMQYLADFISCGEAEEKPGPVLLDWEQDAVLITADINKIAGKEIRSVEFMHWWTFMALFRAIGEGQLLTVVTIRDKLRRGKPLEKWEKEFYSKNKKRVDLKKVYSAEELAEQERLKQLLGE